MRPIRFVKLPKNLHGARVLLRVDFNEPLRRGHIEDTFRIRRTLPTIKDLKRRGVEIILAAHLEDTKTKKPISFTTIHAELARIIGERISFVRDYSRAAVSRACGGKNIVLLENVRLSRGELANDSKFARLLASLADLYVNEAFSVSHRKHASIVGVPRFLPAYAGALFQEEVSKLSEALRPPHPFLLIIGGAKFDTKFALLKRFVPKADAIFLGGVLANTFLRAHGVPIGRSVYEKSALSDVRKHFLISRKIILPFDVLVSKKTSPKNVFEVEERERISDIGPETLSRLAELARGARFVLWNGPLGHTDGGFERGTRGLVMRLLRLRRVKVIVGGGDTLAILDRVQPHPRFYHISTGGGAMLDFLADGTLPGIEAIHRARAKTMRFRV